MIVSSASRRCFNSAFPASRPGPGSDEPCGEREKDGFKFHTLVGLSGGRRFHPYRRVPVFIPARRTFFTPYLGNRLRVSVADETSRFSGAETSAFFSSNFRFNPWITARSRSLFNARVLEPRSTDATNTVTTTLASRRRKTNAHFSTACRRWVPVERERQCSVTNETRSNSPLGRIC